MTITEPAPAKINLALHVRRKRPDGYHDLETLFAFAQDGDTITIEPVPKDSFDITGPFAAALDHPHPSGANAPPSLSPRDGNEEGRGKHAPTPPPNLVLRARDTFRTIFTCPPVAITLDKHLPIAAGIGGGSADAAATLRALARLTGTDPTDPSLHAIAATLGADVPACLAGRTALGSGRGDDLTPLAGLPDTPLLLVNPGVAVSTAAIFAAWDGIDRGPFAPVADLLATARAGRNDLQPPATVLAPVIADVMALLDAAPGVRLARMSGSGATCFALFDTVAAMQAAQTAADARGWWTLATALGA